MIRTASLLVAFSLLTSAATAYAECVWVLWQRHIQPDGWMISRAFQTQRECESEVPNEELRIKNMREVMNKFTEQQSARPCPSPKPHPTQLTTADALATGQG